MPHLRRRDTIALLGGSDVLEINSVVFATAASTQPKIIGAPSLGVYQIAPGQLAMFDVVLAGQKCSPLGSAYRTAGQTRQTVNCNTLSPSPRLQRRLVKARADADARSSPSRFVKITSPFIQPLFSATVKHKVIFPFQSKRKRIIS